MFERTCAIEDCALLAESRGWCSKHYQRWLRHGDPLVFRPDLADPEVRRLRKLAYARWHSMIDRCTNPKAKQWKDYGGRGITVCERWQDFENYYADAGDMPEPGLCFGRVDNDDNYDPRNTRWETRSESNRNQRPRVLATSCSKGHEYTDATTYVGPDGIRACHQCIRDRTANRSARRRAYAAVAGLKATTADPAK